MCKIGDLVPKSLTVPNGQVDVWSECPVCGYDTEATEHTNRKSFELWEAKKQNRNPNIADSAEDSPPPSKPKETPADPPVKGKSNKI